jgi:hypothetical protein
MNAIIGKMSECKEKYKRSKWKRDLDVTSISRDSVSYRKALSELKVAFFEFEKYNYTVGYLSYRLLKRQNEEMVKIASKAKIKMQDEKKDHGHFFKYM